MGKIIILDETTANKIAAGEVIERPSSVIKELVENSIDAGAGNITVEIKKGGISYIKVIDDGTGIESDDLILAFERHGTSKIKNADDLMSINSMGFRGEALASISTVSRVDVYTKTKDAKTGFHLRVEGGKTTEFEQAGCKKGTVFIVRDLFFNTPARYKFLKSDSAESRNITEIMTRIALGNPNTAFKLINNGKIVLQTPGNSDLKSTLYSIYGKETVKNVMEIRYNNEQMDITGYAGTPETARGNRNYELIFLNNRYIKNKTITAAIEQSYSTLLMKNRFPFCIIMIKLNPALVDVNVHPAKLEVRFSDDKAIFRSVLHAVEGALQNWINEKKQSSVMFRQPVQSRQYQTKSNLSSQVGSEDELSGRIYDNKKNEKVIKKESYIEPIKVQANIFNKESYKEKPEEIISNTEKHDKNENGGQKPVRQNVLDAQNKKIEEGNFKITGQAFNTYIIIEKNEEILIIDQHAAHERVLYEQIRNNYNNGRKASQMLIAPVSVDVSYEEMQFAADNMEFLLNTGFEIEAFGNNTLLARAVPMGTENKNVRRMVIDILDELSGIKENNQEKWIDRALYRIACRAAVKSNRKLNEPEIRELLDKLSGLENPNTCPHGRPIVVKITKYEMEKMFKR